MFDRLTSSIRRRGVRVLKPFARGLDPESIRLSLCDTGEATADAWIDTFRDVDAVEIIHGDILLLQADALVSPANSFGDMSGGLDKQIDDFYHGQAQRSVVEAIGHHHWGELPVGAALIVRLPSRQIPHLIAAPTMRVPGPVPSTPNAYLSMRAALVAVLRHNRQTDAAILHVAVPGLCTGVGGMSPGLAARQMREAYDNIIGEGWRDIVHPSQAPFALGNSGKRWSWSDPASR